PFAVLPTLTGGVSAAKAAPTVRLASAIATPKTIFLFMRLSVDDERDARRNTECENVFLRK
ncbi:MAG: hypothetical protein ACREDL_16450, partial [Bradyrhizobium sp.]